MLSRNTTRHLFLILAASGAVALSSCGGDEEVFAKRYPVTGTVTYNGQPLERGTISFIRDKDVGSIGTIENGTYSMSTGGDKDGALPGKYKVTIISKEDVTAKAKAEFAKDSKQADSEITRVPAQFMARATANAKSLIPLGYGDPRTTTLTAEVKEISNEINFTLSDQDAPPEPPKSNAKGKGRHK